MAKHPISGPAAPVTLTGDMDPRDLFRLMSSFDPRQLAGFVDVAIGLIDLADGDPDLEDNADREASNGDDRDQAWVEWSTMRGTSKTRHNLLAGQEDEEEDDAPEQDDPGEEDDPAGMVDEDGVNTVTPRAMFGDPVGPGCLISDDDGQAMQHDVPTLPVVALEPSIFTGEREFLGLSNLLTSYRSNGKALRSADSGRAFRSHATLPKMGVPV